MAIFRDMMMNQIKVFVLSAVSLRSVTAKAVFVHASAVIVIVAREESRRMNLVRSLISRSQLCFPNLNSLTRICVMISVDMMAN